MLQQAQLVSATDVHKMITENAGAVATLVGAQYAHTLLALVEDTVISDTKDRRVSRAITRAITRSHTERAFS